MDIENSFPARDRLQDTTDWKQVTLIIGAGVIGAAQIGKAAIAVPLIRDDFNLALSLISSIVSAYAMLGAVGGMAAGFVVSHFEMRRVILVGLMLIAAGNLLGAIAADVMSLITARALEGVGFLGLVVAGSTLLRSFSSKRHQSIIFACWSAYIPVGAAAMMLVGPYLMQGNWRFLWIANGAIAGMHAALFMLIRPRDVGRVPVAIRTGRQDVLDILRSKSVMLMALSMVLYAIQYFALATFLPVFLVDRMGFILKEAGTISAVAILANAIGNICAGVLLRNGAQMWMLAAIVFGTIGIAGFAIFSENSPVFLVAIGAGLCLGITALLPASIIATMPTLSPSSQQLALSMGLVQQCSALGQCIGPVILAFWVQQFTWSGVPYLFVVISMLGLTIVAIIRNALRIGREI